MANNAQSTVSSGSDVVSAARENLQTKFNVKVFQLILLIVGRAGSVHAGVQSW